MPHKLRALVTCGITVALVGLVWPKTMTAQRGAGTNNERRLPDPVSVDPLEPELGSDVVLPGFQLKRWANGAALAVVSYGSDRGRHRGVEAFYDDIAVVVDQEHLTYRSFRLHG